MKKQTDQEFQHRFEKMVKGTSPLLLEKGQLSDTLNMIPGFEWEQRKGMAALTAAAIVSGLEFKSMVQYRDLRGDTDVIIAHTYDGTGGEDLYQGSALPPNAITWTKQYDLTASCTKCQFAVSSKALIIANSKDFLIWRGVEHFPTGVWKYTNANTAYTLFAEELFDDDTATNMPIDSFTTDDEILVLSDMPLDKISPIIGDVNATVSELEVYVWIGSWQLLHPYGGIFSDGSWDEHDGSDFTGWQDDDSGNGVSSLVTFDGFTCFKLDNGSAGAGNDAERSHDPQGGGSWPDDMSWTIRIYHAALGTLADGDGFEFVADDGSSQHTLMFCTDGLFAWDGAAFNEVGTDIVEVATWQTWTIVSDFGPDTMSIYLEGVLVESGIDVSQNAVNAAKMRYRSNGDTTANRITYVNTTVCGTGTVNWNDDQFVDGTDSGGATMAQTGDITWLVRTDEVKTDVQGIPGYAYKLKVLTALDSSVTITGLSVHAPMGPVANIWNSQWEPPTGCYLNDGTDNTDYTAYVNNTVESQYMDLSGVTTTDKIYIGFVVRVNKILFWPAAVGKNTNNVAITAVKYHNAAGVATTVGTVTDTTTTASKLFSQHGYFSWVAPGEASEKMTIIGGDNTPMFWYEITIDAALVDPTFIYYIRGVPVTKDPDPSRGVFAYKRRVWQIAPRNLENKVRYSAQDLPNTWNGVDSGYMAFGERPLWAAAPFYNETLLFADTEMWMLQGNSPSNFGRLRLSGKIGTNAPESVVNIESGVIVADSLKVVVAWQFFDGFWMFDGVRVWKISAPDIDSFFDPDHDDYIAEAYLDQTYGEYDFASQTVRWAVYSGSGATSPTKVVVMHFPTLHFGIFDYATDISAMLSVVNNKYYLVGGGHSDGRFYQLDSGLTDLLSGTATAVDAWVITRDEFLGYGDGLRQRLMSIWHEAESTGGQLELDEYPDGSKTPQNIAKSSLTVKGKIFGALQRTLKFFPGQKTTKFRIRNRSKNARMKILGHSTTVDKGRANE